MRYRLISEEELQHHGIKGQISDDDDSWGGLTAMELDLTKE